MDNTENLALAIKKICDAYWNEKESPLLLSAMPPLLEKELPEFRTVLAGRSLKFFIEEKGAAAGYKLAWDPKQPVRVGVVPNHATYIFSPEPIKNSVTTNNSTASKKPAQDSNNRDITLSFLKALASLPQEEINKVNIPVSALIKLLK